MSKKVQLREKAYKNNTKRKQLELNKTYII